MARGGSAQSAISVIMPAHNAERFVEDALLCLVAQDFEDFEVIVVDDGSEDGTRGIVEYIASGDARFRYIFQDRRGAGSARNRGMDESQGRYLLFLDSDDLFDPGFLGTLHALAESSGADVAMCSADCFAEDPAVPFRRWEAARYELENGVFGAGALASRLYQCASVVVWNKLFRADFVARNRLRFQDLPRFNDAYFTICALAHASLLAKTRDVLVHYRMGHSSSLAGSGHLAPLCDLQAFDAAHASLEEEGLLSPELRRSFDSLCVNTVVWRLVQFARTSPEATRELFDAYFTTYENRWGLDGAHWPYLVSARYALELALVRRAGVDGLVRAAQRDGRGRVSAQNALAEARFVARLFSAGRALPSGGA